MADLTKIALDNGHFVESTEFWAQTEHVIALLTENIDFYNILTKVTSVWKARKIKNKLENTSLLLYYRRCNKTSNS